MEPENLRPDGLARLIAALVVDGMTTAELTSRTGLHRDTIRARLKLVGITAEDRALPWHHPHYIGLDPTTGLYWHKPFTGDEPEPILADHRTAAADWDKPLDSEPDREHARRDAEWAAMHDQWSRARYTKQMGVALALVDPYWDRLMAAWDERRTAFRQLTNAPDGYWTATVSRCVAAHHELEAAADAWDTMWDGINEIGKSCHLDRLQEAGLALNHAEIAAANRLQVKHQAWIHTDGSGAARRAVDRDIAAERRHIADVSSLISAGKAGHE